MSMQSNLNFTLGPQREQNPNSKNETRIDVSDIARGIGFTTAVHFSIGLNDAFQPLRNEIEGDYDQRL